MVQKDILLATKLWALAEDFNREEYNNIALALKMAFKDYYDELSKADQQEVMEEIRGVGG